MSISDNRTVKQPSSSSGVYQRLDPAAIAALRQPPAPSVYASLSITNASQGVHEANSEVGHPWNYAGLDQASLNDRPATREYAGISVHPDVIELSTSDNGTREHPASAAYHGLDPAAVAVLRQLPASSVYASVSPNTTDVGQVVHNAESDGGHPGNSEGVDPASSNENPLPHDYAGISGT